MFSKRLRACVACFVFAALLPLSAANALPTGPRMASDSSFINAMTAIEDLGSSFWSLCCQVLAKAGLRADQNGNH
jgi:hypothetical protein